MPGALDTQSTQAKGSEGEMTGRRILFKVLGVVIGLIFIGYGVHERSTLARMKSAGQVAVVEPVANYTEFSTSGSKVYTAEFRFQTATGQQVTKKSSFPEEVLADFKSGTPVRVIYDPRDPGEFVFERQQAAWSTIAIGVAIALLALVLV
jgi:hypothetical protein